MKFKHFALGLVASALCAAPVVAHVVGQYFYPPSGNASDLS